MKINIKLAEKGDDFVGIKKNKTETSVYFPIGYFNEEKEINVDRDFAFEIRRLINLIKRNKYERDFSYNIQGNEIDDYPIDSYMEMINYYIENGYYIEKEIKYKLNNIGNINWKRTISKVHPFIQNNKNLCSFVYNDFVIRENKINDNNFLTKIHKYCVNLSFAKIGFFFNYNFSVDNKLLEVETNKQFIDCAIIVVKDKLNNTYNDQLKKLFNNILNILKSVNLNNKDFYILSYGTKSFENIWENLINDIFGISNKKEYNPKTFWGNDENKEIDNKNSLVIDTIMFDKINKEIFIIDAKYYQQKKLPQSSDINKQITYGDKVYKYIEDNNSFENVKVNKNNIYNVFILPNYLQEEKIKYYKTAKSDWRPFKGEENKKHLEIKAIYFDTKTLLNLLHASYKEKEEYKQKLITVIKQ